MLLQSRYEYGICGHLYIFIFMKQLMMLLKCNFQALFSHHIKNTDSMQDHAAIRLLELPIDGSQIFYSNLLQGFLRVVIQENLSMDPVSLRIGQHIFKGMSWNSIAIWAMWLTVPLRSHVFTMEAGTPQNRVVKVMI